MGDRIMPSSSYPEGRVRLATATEAKDNIISRGNNALLGGLLPPATRFAQALQTLPGPPPALTRAFACRTKLLRTE